MNKSASFVYWKRPWHPWVMLLCAGVQLLCLVLSGQDCKAALAAGDPHSTLANLRLGCACNGLLSAAFLGHVLIGWLAHSRKAAGRAEAALYLVLVLGWVAAGVALDLTATRRGLLCWGLVLLAAIFAIVHGLYQSRKAA